MDSRIRPGTGGRVTCVVQRPASIRDCDEAAVNSDSPRNLMEE